MIASATRRPNPSLAIGRNAVIVRRFLGQLSWAFCASIFFTFSLDLPSLAQAVNQAAAASNLPSEVAFDVATIRPSKPGTGGSTYSFTPGHGIKVSNGTLKGLIEMAYDLRDFQIQGGPGWADSESFDIVAKCVIAPSDSAPGAAAKSIEDTRLRLQALLRDRFQLEVRRESKDLPEYMLAVGKSGPKFKPSGADHAAGSTAGINAACGRMVGTNTTMANLAYKLSRSLDRPVVDQTALTGSYDFVLSWTPDTGPCAASNSAPDSAAASNAGDGPSLFTALQEQLGLKLDSVKGPVDTLVIDHVERPSPN
jgi:bla regulator protein blaR1